MIKQELSRRSPILILSIFTMVHILLSFDRSITSIIAESIKSELSLSDKQLGLVAGSSFALAFGLAGLPLGYLADRSNRRNLLAISVLIFSGATALGSQVTLTSQLIASRMVVGIGEAACSPAMVSIMTDLFRPQRRASAMAVYYAGVPLGAILAFLIGGAVAARWGWRAAFIAAGVPGVLVALCIVAFVEEPQRATSGNGSTAISLPKSLRFIFGQRSLRHMLVASALTSAATSGLITFSASYLVRSHGLQLAQVGVLLALFYGVVGVIGGLLAGRLVDRIAADDDRKRPRFCAIANFGAAAAVPVMVLSPQLAGAVFGLGAIAMLTNGTYGALLAMLQSLVGSRMRGVLTSLYYFFSYLIGAGSGPLIVGVMSDSFRLSLGDGALRYAMLVCGLLYVWGAAHFWAARRWITDDIERAARL